MERNALMLRKDTTRKECANAALILTRDGRLKVCCHHSPPPGGHPSVQRGMRVSADGDDLCMDVSDFPELCSGIDIPRRAGGGAIGRGCCCCGGPCGRACAWAC